MNKLEWNWGTSLYNNSFPCFKLLVWIFSILFYFINVLPIFIFINVLIKICIITFVIAFLYFHMPILVFCEWVLHFQVHWFKVFNIETGGQFFQFSDIRFGRGGHLDIFITIQNSNLCF